MTPISRLRCIQLPSTALCKPSPSRLDWTHAGLDHKHACPRLSGPCSWDGESCSCFRLPNVLFLFSTKNSSHVLAFRFVARIIGLVPALAASSGTKQQSQIAKLSLALRKIIVKALDFIYLSPNFPTGFSSFAKTGLQFRTVPEVIRHTWHKASGGVVANCRKGGPGKFGGGPSGSLAPLESEERSQKGLLWYMPSDLWRKVVCEQAAWGLVALKDLGVLALATAKGTILSLVTPLTAFQAASVMYACSRYLKERIAACRKRKEASKPYRAESGRVGSGSSGPGAILLSRLCLRGMRPSCRSGSTSDLVAFVECD